MHEVQLDVLARGHVEDTIRVLLGQLRQHVQLIRRQRPERDLDPLHAGRVPEGHGALGDLPRGEHQRLGGLAVVALAIVVALSVDPASQPRLREQLLLDLSLLAELELGLENVDLASPCLGDLGAECFLPGSWAVH